MVLLGLESKILFGYSLLTSLYDELVSILQCGYAPEAQPYTAAKAWWPWSTVQTMCTGASEGTQEK